MGRARVGLGYWRRGAVGLTVGIILAIGGAGAALAADPATDVVADGVVTVHWVDAEDGPIAGASIQITYSHKADDTAVILRPGVTDAAGDAVFSGVPRAADGSAPIFLSVRGDHSTTTTDEAGCTAVATWLAETDDITSEAAVEVSLVTSSKGLDMTCPEPDPGGDPAPGGDPQPGGDPAPGGGVLGATGKPQITLPPTDVAVAPGSRTASGTPILPTLLLVLGAGAIVLPITVRATVPVRRHRQ
jgi:hypothetical protein